MVFTPSPTAGWRSLLLTGFDDSAESLVPDLVNSNIHIADVEEVANARFSDPKSQLSNGAPNPQGFVDPGAPRR